MIWRISHRADTEHAATVELQGELDGWRVRAEKAEAERDEARAACAAWQAWLDDLIVDFTGVTDDEADTSRFHGWDWILTHRPTPNAHEDAPGQPLLDRMAKVEAENAKLRSGLKDYCQCRDHPDDHDVGLCPFCQIREAAEAARQAQTHVAPAVGGGAMTGRVLDDFCARTAQQVGRQRSCLIEERIRLLVNDRPEWCPEPTWQWMLSLVLRMETSQPTARTVEVR